ncbi:unnamed protein product [Albugo candida]|uniref:Uncharacterized protein n=1 Tax=Albugo candida TaxID=65357 RepID=A0A024GLD5_9STRA|nr:unnamed protein product [Albugo candida]|eukprot:CCI47325.1 unnamed protein product [Albugo candida]
MTDWAITNYFALERNCLVVLFLCSEYSQFSIKQKSTLQNADTTSLYLASHILTQHSSDTGAYCPRTANSFSDCFECGVTKCISSVKPWHATLLIIFIPLVFIVSSFRNRYKCTLFVLILLFEHNIPVSNIIIIP